MKVIPTDVSDEVDPLTRQACLSCDLHRLYQLEGKSLDIPGFLPRRALSVNFYCRCAASLYHPVDGPRLCTGHLGPGQTHLRRERPWTDGSS